MLIQCPGCKTKYSFDGQRVGAEGIKLRCGKCNGIFRVTRRGQEPADSPQAGSAPSGRPAGISVVVANESAILCKSVKEVLGREAIEVTAFHDGREAFDFIVSRKPDVVLLDVALPSMYGFEVCEAIRKIPDLSPVKIILIASIYDKTKYKRAPVSLYGADDYIEKHHIPDSLAAMIYRLVSGQKPVDSPAGPPAETEEEAQASTQELSRGELIEQESARQELRKDEENETTPPAPHSEPEISEAHVKARRFARLIVSDIVLYNQPKVEEGVKNGTFYHLMADEIAEGKALFQSRIPKEISEGASFMEEAFEELIRSKIQELGC